MQFLHIVPPPVLSIKALVPLVASGDKSGFGLMSAPPTPSCQHLKQGKLSFPPTWPVYWLLSGEQPDPTYIL